MKCCVDRLSRQPQGGHQVAKDEVAATDRWKGGPVIKQPARTVKPALRMILALLDLAQLNDTGLQRDHALHRVRLSRRWIRAIERDAGTHEVMMRLLPQKNPGRIGQRPRNPVELRTHRAEALHLDRIERMIVLRAREMAHPEKG